MLHITFGFLFCCNMLVLPTYKVSRHPHTLWLRLINVQWLFLDTQVSLAPIHVSPSSFNRPDSAYNWPWSSFNCPDPYIIALIRDTFELPESKGEYYLIFSESVFSESVFPKSISSESVFSEYFGSKLFQPKGYLAQTCSNWAYAAACASSELLRACYSWVHVGINSQVIP